MAKPSCEPESGGKIWWVNTLSESVKITRLITILLTGDGWAEVDPPGANLRLTQVGVGIDSVWAVTDNGSVWFRKGVSGQSSTVCEQMATGTGWVDMASKMALISVSPDDQVTSSEAAGSAATGSTTEFILPCFQVWAIGHDDRCLYYRTGIRGTDRTGKRWRMVNAPLQLSRASSNASLSSSNRHSLCGTPQTNRHQSWGSLVRWIARSESHG